MPEIKVSRDVPDDRKQTVIDNYYADGAADVTSKKENGTWTIIATFP